MLNSLVLGFWLGFSALDTLLPVQISQHAAGGALIKRDAARNMQSSRSFTPAGEPYSLTQWNYDSLGRLRERVSTFKLQDTSYVLADSFAYGAGSDTSRIANLSPRRDTLRLRFYL